MNSFDMKSIGYRGFAGFPGREVTGSYLLSGHRYTFSVKRKKSRQMYNGIIRDSDMQAMLATQNIRLACPDTNAELPDTKIDSFLASPH